MALIFVRGCREAQAWFPWHRQLAAPRATTPVVAPRATTPLASGWLGRASTAHRAALTRSLAPWQPWGSEPWHEHQDGALQAAGALHPASMCSVCSAVHRSSLSEIGLEMCVPMFLAP